jgi:2'-5' RNA ligase
MTKRTTAAKDSGVAWWIEARVPAVDTKGRGWFERAVKAAGYLLAQETPMDDLHVTIAYLGTCPPGVALDTFGAMAWDERAVPAQIRLGALSIFGSGTALVAELFPGRAKSKIVTLMEEAYALAEDIGGVAIPHFSPCLPHVTLGKPAPELRALNLVIDEGEALGAVLRETTLAIEYARLCSYKKGVGTTRWGRRERRTTGVFMHKKPRTS